MPESIDTSFDELFQAHPIPMWVYDLATLAFRAVNTAALQHYGYTEPEFLSMDITALRPPEELPRLMCNLRNAPPHALERSGVWRHRKKSGELIDVEISSHPLQYQGCACRFVLAHDVTDRIAVQKKLARMNRVYAVLSGINAAIVRIRDRDALFREACRLATIEGGFLGASIGLADVDDTQAVHAGVSLPQLPPGFRALWPDRRAVHARAPIVVNDIASDPALAPLAAQLDALAIRSSAAFPLMVGNRMVAVLTLLADAPDVFDDDELKVLNELAGDLAFALLFFDREEQLSYLAYYDAMTGLPNRQLFQDRLAQLINHDGKAQLALILINLDRFAQLNDALGRHNGDALLVQVARRLEACMPASGNVARVGADTFGLTYPSLERGESADELLRQVIFRALDQP
ncbi:MAG TPA: diguanylate cyclase, partial [Telluria sp.]